MPEWQDADPNEIKGVFDQFGNFTDIHNTSQEGSDVCSKKSDDLTEPEPLRDIEPNNYENIKDPAAPPIDMVDEVNNESKYEHDNEPVLQPQETIQGTHFNLKISIIFILGTA